MYDSAQYEAVADERLHASDAKYRLLFDSIDEGFCIIEILFDKGEQPVDYRFLEVNPAFVRQTGLHNATGKTMRELAPAHEAHWFVTYGHIALTGESIRFENRAAALDDRWYDVYAFRIGEPEQRRVAILFNDISERKRGQEALRASEERYRMALTAAELGTWKHDFASDDVQFDARSRAHYGIERDLVPLADVLARVHADDLSSLQRVMAAALDPKIKGAVAIEYRVVDQDAAIRWLSIYGRVDFEGVGEEQRPIRGVGTTQDITARKRAEEALQASEERFRAAFARAPIGMVLTTVTGKLVETNQAFCDITGYSPEDLAGAAFTDLIHPDDVAGTRELYDQLLSGNIPSFTIEKRYICKVGRVIWVRAHKTLRRDKDGQPQEVVGLVEKIDERKKAEEERERLLAELERSNTELSQFSHVVSHDLQAPIRMVNSFSELLARRYKGQLDQTANEFIATIQEAVSSMEQLVQTLLKYAMVGQELMTVRPVGLESVADAALTLLQPMIEETQAEVTCGRLPTIKGDRVLLQQVFQNHIANALKYRRPGVPPRIRLDANERGGEWLISVSDNGEGIDPRHYNSIFAPLKRLHGNEIPGTGIGLAVCKRIIERHGGHIWVESVPGEGSTFCFTLPR